MNASEAIALLRSLPVFRFDAHIEINPTAKAFAQYDGFKDGVAQLRFQSEDAANPHQVVHEYGHAIREKYVTADKFSMPQAWKAIADAALWSVPTVEQWGAGASPYDEAFAQCVGWLWANWVPIDSGLRPGTAPVVKAYILGCIPSNAPVVSPTPPTGTNTAAVPDFAAHWFSQWASDHVGRGDCVPTCAKMLLSLYGLETPTIAELRTRCDIDDDGVVNLGRDAGITIDAARAALSDYGLAGVAFLSRDVGFDDVVGHVREGHPSMVFVVYADIPSRQDTGFGGLHAVVLAGIDGTRAVVLDPDNARDVPAPYPLDDLRRGWNDGQTLGGGAFIPDRTLGGDMDDARVNELIAEYLATKYGPALEAELKQLQQDNIAAAVKAVAAKLAE